MKRTYQVVTKPSTLSSRELAEFLSKDGQLLLPFVELLGAGREGHRRGDRRHGSGDRRGGPSDER